MKSIEIVFVEFGRVVKHLSWNIRRLNKLFPNVPVTLLTDRTNEYKSLQDFCKILHWNTSNIEELRELALFKETGDSFWLHTTSRLFAFCDYHAWTDSQALLHVESDVLLSSDFPFEKFLEVDRLLWGQYNGFRDVAALIFSPAREKSELLKLSMSTEIRKNKNHTDMTLLSAVAKGLGREHAYLPSFDSTSSFLINANSGISDTEVQLNLQMYPFFEGIFDHQALGMWIDGIDPIHTFGFRKSNFKKIVTSGESYVDSTRVQYCLTKPFRLTISKEGRDVKLYSLHMHSKSKTWFRLDNLHTLTRLLTRVNKGTSNRRLDTKVLFGLFVSNMSNGTFGDWLLHALKKLSKKFL